MPQSTLIPALWELPERLRSRLGDDVGRQRAMVAEGHLLLVLHAPPAPDAETREARIFWRAPDGAWRAAHGGAGLGVLKGHLAEYGQRIDALEAAEDAASDAAAYFGVLHQATPLQRTARNLHAAVQSARAQLPEVLELINLRDAAYALERNAEFLVGDTRNGLDYWMARQAERQAVEAERMARAGHRLNVLAAIFLPTATIASVLGMNIRSGFEDTLPPWGLLAVLALGAGLGVVVRSSLERP